MINYFFTSHFMIHRKAGYFLESSPEKCIKHAIYEIKIKKLYTVLDFLYIKRPNVGLNFPLLWCRVKYIVI